MISVVPSTVFPSSFPNSFDSTSPRYLATSLWVTEAEFGNYVLAEGFCIRVPISKGNEGRVWQLCPGREAQHQSPYLYG